MDSIEIQAKSLDEAKQLAAEKLGVSADQVDVKVIEETKGLFGKSSLRVQATVLATAAAAAPAKAEKPARSKPAKPAPVEPEPEPEAPAEPEAAKPARRGRGKKEAEPVAAASEEAPAAVDASDEEGEPEIDVTATNADAEQVLDILDEILEYARLNADLKVTSISGRYVNIELDGQDVAYLVGKHGEVLNSLQYLTNVIVGKKLANGVRITLEGNNYRRRREESLTKLATQIAEQVRARGEEAVLDALPAFERRVVHKALVEFEGVATYSEGEEPNRRVVIAPA